MAGEHHLYARVGEQGGGGKVIAHDKVMAEEALQGHVVQQVMVHHQQGEAAVLISGIRLLQHPARFCEGHAVLGGNGGVAAVQRDQEVSVAQVRRIGAVLRPCGTGVVVAQVFIDLLEIGDIGFRAAAEVVVAVDHEHLDAGCLLEGQQLIAHGIVLLGDASAVIRQIARDQHEIHVFLCAVGQERVDDKAALVFHGGAAVGVAVEGIVRKAGEGLLGQIIVQVAGHRNGERRRFGGKRGQAAERESECQ